MTVVGGLLIVWQIVLVAAFPASAAALGANKFDLMLDYVAPSPPAGAGPEGYRRVRRAMAEKAIADARDAGLSFFRVAITGYSPSDFNTGHHDLSLWQSDPPRFWAAFDAMFDDLDRAGIGLVPSFVWNIRQFPALGNDSIATFVRDPNSASRRLLAQFVRDFIARYKARKTILFYELGNEMNLLADLDEHKNCKGEPCVWGNFTTADMDKFAREVVALIKSSDPSRPVTSGYSLPRPAATHLEQRPQFSAGGADWTPDTVPEFDRNLIAIHQPFDIISIHVYPEDQARPSGRIAGEQFDPVAAAAKAARAAGKKLFIGEFGDPSAGPTPFIADLLDEFVRERVDFAAIWVWEFYQTSTYTPVPQFNVEPGYTDDTIGLLMDTARRLGTGHPPGKAGAPRVVLTWPLPCATIDRPVDLAAIASDGAKSVARVEFLIDGKPLAFAAAAPYRSPFDPAGQGSRTAEIEVRVIAGSAAAAFRSTVHLNGDKGRCHASG